MNTIPNTCCSRRRCMKQIIILVVAMIIASHESIKAQCPVTLLIKSVAAAAQKCGFTETCTSTPTCSVVQYYLVSTYLQSISGSELVYNGGIPAQNINFHSNQTLVQTEDPNSCSSSSVYSGSAFFEIDPYPGFGNLFECSGSITNATTGEWDAGGGEANYEAYQAPNDYGYSTNITICSSAVSGDTTSGSMTSDQQETGSYTESSLTGLSNPYTDKMLRNKMMGELPAYPSDWNGGDASFDMSFDHSYCSGSQMQYCFFLCNQYVEGHTYLIQWQEVTTYPADCVSGTNPPPSIQVLSENVTYNGGQTGMYTPIRSVPVPGTPCWIDEINPSATETTSSPPGSGGGGGGGGGSGNKPTFGN